MVGYSAQGHTPSTSKRRAVMLTEIMVAFINLRGSVDGSVWVVVTMATKAQPQHFHTVVPQDGTSSLPFKEENEQVEEVKKKYKEEEHEMRGEELENAFLNYRTQ